MHFPDSFKFGPRRSSRGFTLIELMVTVVIIGLLAAIALPQMATRMRERRANQASQQIALMYRNARLRAMGRGFPVMVRYSASTGAFRVVEALPSGGVTNCIARTPPTCMSVADWGAVAATRQVESFNPTISATTGNYAGLVVAVTAQPANTTANVVDMCFSPHGRTFSRLVASNALTPMTGTIDVIVNRGANTLSRHVTILPNGMARLAL